jgi:hypothetical protein
VVYFGLGWLVLRNQVRMPFIKTSECFIWILEWLVYLTMCLLDMSFYVHIPWTLTNSGI